MGEGLEFMSGGRVDEEELEVDKVEVVGEPMV
jgi:hypothetical protein